MIVSNLSQNRTIVSGFCKDAPPACKNSAIGDRYDLSSVDDDFLMSAPKGAALNHHCASLGGAAGALFSPSEKTGTVLWKHDLKNDYRGSSPVTGPDGTIYTLSEREKSAGISNS